MKTESNTMILDRPIFAWVITVLIFYSVISFSIETLPDLSPSAKSFLYYSEIVIVSLFTLEYLFRIYVAQDKLKFIFSFYGLVDLLAILPFYIATTIDLRSIRLIRILRLARILKLVRYGEAVKRLVKAISLVKEELIIFTLTSLILLYLAAVGIYHFEHTAQPDTFRSIFDCLWWAVATLTTVGYGDIYPITVGGRLFTFFILIIGLGLIAIPTGIIASALTQVRQIDNE